MAGFWLFHASFLWVGIGLLASLVILALAAHVLPGFNSVTLLENIQTSPTSTPYDLRFSLDKPLALWILISVAPDLRGVHRHPTLQKLVLPLLLIPFTLILAWQLGLIHPAWSFPVWILAFAFKNLIFTCVLEEAFFRGFWQQRLSRYWHPVAAIGFISILFGFAHLGGGLSYVLVASLAGVAYGWVFAVSGRVSYAISAHFLLNMLHFMVFTYPLAV